MLLRIRRAQMHVLSEDFFKRRQEALKAAVRDVEADGLARPGADEAAFERHFNAGLRLATHLRLEQHESVLRLFTLMRRLGADFIGSERTPWAADICSIEMAEPEHVLDRLEGRAEQEGC